MADLTGQPYLPTDRESAHAKRVVTQIELGLNEATLDDVPDVPPRPLAELAERISASAELRDTARYRQSGEDIDAALIELQVHVVAGEGRERLRLLGGHARHRRRGRGPRRAHRTHPRDGAVTYPATSYLQRLTADHGWHGRLLTDEHGDPLVIVTVRVGPTWTDSVAIEGKHRAVAMRHRIADSDLIVPSGPVWTRVGPGVVVEPPGGSTAVWHRDGRCDDVLAELLELPEGQPQ